MRLSWADRLRKEGQEQGVQETLLRLLGARFGTLPEDVKQRVESIRSVERLNQIADQILVARSLEEIGLQ